jgi:predicted pyridoxine 5'-phosphate oxidase superfamily flavin-nucleotide-binding protein
MGGSVLAAHAARTHLETGGLRERLDRAAPRRVSRFARHTPAGPGIERGVQGPFHDGEREMQRRAGAREDAAAAGRSIRSELPRGTDRFLARQRLAVAASLDARGRVWASLLTGPPGFIQPVDPQLLRLAARPTPGDPLAGDLETRPELGLLVLDPTTRQRMRFNGRGMLRPEGLFLLIDQAYGNCPKYIQRREPEPDGEAAAAEPVRVSATLDGRQRSSIARADTLFIASFHPEGGADASHRGGRPGFVRVLAEDRLAFDNYPGNGMFNTLGNLAGHPQAGLLILDFETGDVLQTSGRSRVEPDFSTVFQVDEVREARAASPLRYRLVEPSPSNPPLSRDGVAGISSAEPDDGRRRRT